MSRKKFMIILLPIIVCGILIFVINTIIYTLNWHFRLHILFFAFLMVSIGIISLIITLISMIKSKIIKYLVLIPSIIICGIIFLISFFIFGLWSRTDIIKNIDGRDYIGIEHLTNRLRKSVYYYEKYNYFAYNDEKIIIEEFYDYDDYKIPEFRTYYKENNEKETIYYDENGNITRTNIW